MPGVLPVGPPDPISAVQAEALVAGTLPPLEQVRDGVWTMAIPFHAGVPDSTLTYVVEGSDGSLALIDPGWGVDLTLDLLEDGLRAVGHAIEDVGLVAVTHLHIDHVGAADAVRARSGARVAMHSAEAFAIDHQLEDRARDDEDVTGWGVPAALAPELHLRWGVGRRIPSVDVPAVVPDLLVEDGDLLPIPGRTLRALWTPGHTTGHLCFVDEPDGLLFTGDHVLPRINSGLGLGGRSTTNPLTDYLTSLDRVSAIDRSSSRAPLEVCPGHEYRFADVGARAAVLADHRAERQEFVAAALDGFAARGARPTMWEVASHVPFRGGIESMTGYLLASALAQTGFHVRALGRQDEVRVAAPPSRRVRG
ncbi:MBL fold metallo-hydrolase [Curtobacterium sp. RRHDQ10]|uniref:MBL fold metallo-hydrolase n=1 Tax=Curtobacterium phyllosphaerae TaxID=3413379 RepID=UPI003BF0BB15